MKCQECEKAAYLIRELSNTEKQKVEAHLQTCPDCRKLFNDLQLTNNLVWNSPVVHSNPAWLTNKIMLGIAAAEPQPGRSVSFVSGYFNLAIARYALAGLSLSLIALFFMEVVNPAGVPISMRGPVARLQSVIINSSDLRKSFAEQKVKRHSALASCKNPLGKNIDLACVREKIKKLYKYE